jgi:SAM-dependent methyltransferase
MQSISRKLHHTIYHYGWEIRNRNLASANVLRSVLSELPAQSNLTLLDVGCGTLGLAEFLPGVGVVGMDLEPPPDFIPDFTFVLGNITALPFPDRSFPIVSCIDVLEHLPLEVREQAINELVRVAAHAVIIGCPHGEVAQKCDEQYRDDCEARNRPLPSWLVEHLRQPYPAEDEILNQINKAAAATGSTVKTSVLYSEPVSISRLSRAAAARSNALFVTVNLFFGVLSKMVPAPDARNSYRMIVLAELEGQGELPKQHEAFSEAAK